MPEARLLARDLGVRWAQRRRPRRGDVVLRLVPRLKRLGREGYALRIGRRVKVRAAHDSESARIAPRLRILAQKTRGPPQLTGSYAEFEGLARASGRSPTQ